MHIHMLACIQLLCLGLICLSLMEKWHSLSAGHAAYCLTVKQTLLLPLTPPLPGPIHFFISHLIRAFKSLTQILLCPALGLILLWLFCPLSTWEERYWLCAVWLGIWWWMFWAVCKVISRSEGGGEEPLIGLSCELSLIRIPSLFLLTQWP